MKKKKITAIMAVIMMAAGLSLCGVALLVGNLCDRLISCCGTGCVAGFAVPQ